MLAIGVDVASISGWAVVEDAHGRETLWEHGIVDVAMDTPLWEQIDRVLDKGHHVATVALELPFLDKNPHVLEVLARLCGQWEHACTMRGLDYVLVHASDWQRSILTGLITVASKREQRKKAARLWVKSTYGVDLDEDRADAVCLATWACRQHRARAAGLIR